MRSTNPDCAFTNTVVGADRDLADQLDPFDGPTHHQVESDGARRPLVDGEQSGPVLRLRVEGDSVLIDGRRVRQQPRSVCEHDVDGDGGGGISVAHIGLRVVEAGERPRTVARYRRGSWRLPGLYPPIERANGAYRPSHAVAPRVGRSQPTPGLALTAYDGPSPRGEWGEDIGMFGRSEQVCLLSHARRIDRGRLKRRESVR